MSADPSAAVIDRRYRSAEPGPAFPSRAGFDRRYSALDQKARNVAARFHLPAARRDVITGRQRIAIAQTGGRKPQARIRRRSEEREAQDALEQRRGRDPRVFVQRRNRQQVPEIAPQGFRLAEPREPLIYCELPRRG